MFSAWAMRSSAIVLGGTRYQAMTDSMQSQRQMFARCIMQASTHLSERRIIWRQLRFAPVLYFTVIRYQVLSET